MNNTAAFVGNSSKVNDSINDMFQANQHFLSAFVEYVRCRLAHAYQESEAVDATAGTESQIQLLDMLKRDMPTLAPIDYLTHLYQLTGFEQLLLLLCIAPELDSALLYPNGAKDPIVVNFSLALAILPDPNWQAIMASGALRRNGLIQLEDSTSVTQSRLIVPESILHFIMGFNDENQGLRASVEVLPDNAVVLDPVNEAVLNEMVQIWRNNLSKQPCLLTLTGKVDELKRDLAVLLAHKISKRVLLLNERFIPKEPRELGQFVAQWQTEMLLHDDVLLVECHDSSNGLKESEQRVDHFFNLLKCSVICVSDARRAHYLGAQFTFDVDLPSSQAQLHCWQTHLTDPHLHSDIQAVSSHFDLSFSQIAALSHTYHTVNGKKALWDICRQHTRQRLHCLAEQIPPVEGGINIILPKSQTDSLNQIIAHVKHKSLVYDEWGFGANGTRGRGLIALFHGASGTGKTTAAEYLASHLRLDLYRVDLSNLVSKYIGETEKNLAQIFSAAERSGAILLFDEADALFSKRTQVASSHDKFANTQVSYLLQRLESFKGLAILTSNLKDSFDAAFIRRLRFVIAFPFPTALEREQIWRTLLPKKAPIGQVNFTQLSRLNVAGGMIRNIMLNACFNSAADKAPLQMQHFLNAVRCEYAKQDKPLNVQEIQGWV